MTVLNGYADLNEVYGSDFSKKKKKIKKLKQPACDYYSKKYKDGNVQPSHSNAFVNEHASYQIGENSNEIAGTDLKSKYDVKKRTSSKYKEYIDNEEELDYFDKLYREHEHQPLENTDGNNIMNYKELPEDDEEDDDKKYKMKIKRRIKVDTLGRPNQHPYYLKDEEDEYSPDKHYLDFGLFLISGILLIFILEQFVRLGIQIREKHLSLNRQQPMYYVQQPVQPVQYQQMPLNRPPTMQQGGNPNFVQSMNEINNSMNMQNNMNGMNSMNGGGVYANTTSNYYQEYPNLRPNSVMTNNTFQPIN